MAKARPILGLDGRESARHALPLVFSTRIAELWSLARDLPYPERVVELHDARIAAKRLRYCFEFFAPCFPESFAKGKHSPLELFKRLQDYLGEIHDCDVWTLRLLEELKRALMRVRRDQGKLVKPAGATVELGRAAAELADELTSGEAIGVLRVIGDLVERRGILHGELVAFWDSLEARDFRGDLLRIVADGSRFNSHELPVAAASSRRDPARRTSAAKMPPQENSWPSGDVRASLDIGSNSVKLLVLRREANGHHEVLADVNQVTGLGRGLANGGALDPAVVKDTLVVLGGLVKRARELGAASIVAAGTAALRTASNPQAILAPLTELGVDARVVSGEEEAALSRAMPLRELHGHHDVVLFDTGGGSTELSWFARGRLRASASVGLGARRLTELARITHPVNEAARHRLLRAIEHELANVPKLSEGVTPFMAGLGGTASVVVWMQRGLHGQERGDPHGATVTAGELRGLQAMLARKTRDEVLAIPNLDPLRADIIYAGVAILSRILRHYGAREFRVVDRGLRWGLLLG